MTWPKKSITHGGARRSGRLPEYSIWLGMRRRCSDPNSKDFAGYGERGIKVCDRWRNSFENFYADMGSRPSPDHSIERKDNEQGYSPDNCIWATAMEQARNRRLPGPKAVCVRNHPLSGDNLYITPRGKRQCRACRRDNCREWFRAHHGRKAVAA